MRYIYIIMHFTYINENGKYLFYFQCYVHDSHDVYLADI